MTLKKWQQEYRDRIAEWNSEGLFDEMADAQVPDDWDGAFTEQGRWRANESVRQVHDRYTRNARLGALATEELAALLERLSNALFASCIEQEYRDSEVAAAHAARIREALALEANGEG